MASSPKAASEDVVTAALRPRRTRQSDGASASAKKKNARRGRIGGRFLVDATRWEEAFSGIGRIGAGEENAPNAK